MHSMFPLRHLKLCIEVNPKAFTHLVHLSYSEYPESDGMGRKEEIINGVTSMDQSGSQQETDNTQIG